MRHFRPVGSFGWGAVGALLRPSFVGFGIWLCAGGSAAGGELLHLKVDADSSRVEYHISFSLSDVTNSAGLPAGEVLADSARGVGFFGRVSVDLRDLSTGIGMRDRHVKSADYLDVDRYPYAELQISEVVADSNVTVGANSTTTGDGASVDGSPARVRGTLRLHGVKQNVEIPVLLHWQGNRVRVRGKFSILLADHGIEQPKRLLLSAGESVEVRLDLLFAP